MNEEIIKKVEDHVYSLFNEFSPPENVYHNYNHTVEVVTQTKNIAQQSNLSEDEIEMLIIAAWFHDTGYFEGAKGHEEISQGNAKLFLTDQNFPQEKIDIITGIIAATTVPQKPQNQLEEIICDADLHHLGMDYFFEKNDLFRLENEIRNDQKYSEYDFLKMTVEFFSHHKYFTQYARKNLEPVKASNFAKLQKQFRKKLEKHNDEKVKKEKIKIEKEKLKAKKESGNKAERGIETMFRNVMRTHVSFSAMADTKANIMISVNTLLLTAVTVVLARKLDNNPHLIIPTLVLTIVSLSSLTIATFVTRPKITSGTFSREDITNKKANLLFFGNFYNMDLKDFQWGMTELIQDKKFLYESMIKDFYFLGQVLGKKYRYLNLCYNIFIYGMIISVIVFAVAVMLNPGGTDIGSIIE